MRQHEKKDAQGDHSTETFEPPGETTYDIMRLLKPLELEEIKDWQATFDVGGDSKEGDLVLTPFSALLESTPRPVMRSMSVSWFVEGVEGTEDEAQYEAQGEAQYEAEEKKRMGKTFKTKGMVKGMWRPKLYYSGRYNIV